MARVAGSRWSPNLLARYFSTDAGIGRLPLGGGADALRRVHDRHGAVQQLYLEPLGRLRSLFPQALAGGLEQAQPLSLGVGVQARHRSSEGQRLVVVKAQPLGDDRRPEGQDGRPVDLDAVRGNHVGDIALRLGDGH